MTETKEQYTAEDRAAAGIARLAESLTAEQIIGEKGWALMGGLLTDPRLIDRLQITEMIERTRMAALLSPVIIAGLDVLSLMTFGGGVTIQAADKSIDEVVQAFWKERTNRNAVTGNSSLMDLVREKHTDGNLFWWFHNTTNGVKVRVIDPMEIQKIATNPDDKDEPWFYHRVWSDTSGGMRQAIYPNINYVPASKPARINGIEVDWTKSVHHSYTKRVGLWGTPSFLAALPWARSYEQFLENRATLYAAYAAIGLLVKAKATRLGSIRAGMSASGRAGESPVKGSMGFVTPDDNIEALNTKDATTSATEGLQFLEMAISVFGFPPHLWGKEESGGLGQDGRHKAFFLRIQAEQEAWKDDISDALEYVIFRAVKEGRLTGATVTRIGNDENIVWPSSVDPSISIEFPELQAKDTALSMSNLILATTLDNKKPTGIVSPKQFISLAAPLIGLEDLDIDLVPDEWPESGEEIQDFMGALSQVVSPEPTPEPAPEQAQSVMSADTETEQDTDDNSEPT